MGAWTIAEPNKWMVLRLKIILYIISYRVVYFKSHHCNSLCGVSGRFTSVLSKCYLTDMEHFNTHHWSNECEQTRENVWCNVNGVKDCKRPVILSIVSILWKIPVNQSWKCPQLTSLIKNYKLAKNVCLFGNIQHLICGKKGYINFRGKTPPFPKKKKK